MRCAIWAIGHSRNCSYVSHKFYVFRKFLLKNDFVYSLFFVEKVKKKTPMWPSINYGIFLWFAKYTLLFWLLFTIYVIYIKILFDFLIKKKTRNVVITKSVFMILYVNILLWKWFFNHNLDQLMFYTGLKCFITISNHFCGNFFRILFEQIF